MQFSTEAGTFGGFEPVARVVFRSRCEREGRRFPGRLFETGYSMRKYQRVLTGAAAAALLGLDGFRDESWPLRWCAPHTSRHQPGVVRVRTWQDPVLVDETLVAPAGLVLRHLGEFSEDLALPKSRLTVADRVELALEHALREGMIDLGDLRGISSSRPGDEVLRSVLHRRGAEPPTESYAETRAAQLFRSFGWSAWRQIKVFGENGRTVHRADFLVLPGPRRDRPEVVPPGYGVLVEIDSRAYHRDAFEKDYDRQATYNRLGYHWVGVTPTQVEDRPAVVRRSIEGVLRKAQNASAVTTPRRRR